MPKDVRASKFGFHACQRCGVCATLRSIDVYVGPIPKRSKHDLGAPAGWCPLIALCGMCWTDVVKMLRDEATPDSSGEVSP
jgi:hypothetical protein